MVKTTTEKQKVEQTVVVHQERVCNRCGRSAVEIENGEKLHDPKEGSLYGGEFMHVSYGGGWHNWVIGDLSSIEFDLCQYCVDELVESFKKKPFVNRGGSHKDSWEVAKQRRPEWRC